MSTNSNLYKKLLGVLVVHFILNRSWLSNKGKGKL